MRAKCLSGALSRKEPTGVWGGELFEDGKVIQEKRAPGRPRIKAVASANVEIVDVELAEEEFSSAKKIA